MILFLPFCSCRLIQNASEQFSWPFYQDFSFFFVSLFVRHTLHEFGSQRDLKFVLKFWATLKYLMKNFANVKFINF